MACYTQLPSPYLNCEHAASPQQCLESSPLCRPALRATTSVCLVQGLMLQATAAEQPTSMQMLSMLCASSNTTMHSFSSSRDTMLDTCRPGRGKRSHESDLTFKSSCQGGSQA